MYNYGRKATLDIFEKLNIAPGFYTKQMCQSMKRKYSAGYKNMDITKKRRKIIRGNKKKKGEKLLNVEGVSYEPGGFD